MESVIEYANKGGYLMGICNGFQILCEAGLLPGALLHNNNQKFICKNIFIQAQTKNSLLTSLPDMKRPLKIPIAHGEGRYYAEESVIKKLVKNDQILFRYCNEKGEITEDSNPNGSLQNIAGITNEMRNVFGLMPHPERAADTELKNTDGKVIFESVLKSLGVSVV
jgi:phosphoribosylformylglycinamidine synthase